MSRSSTKRKRHRSREPRGRKNRFTAMLQPALERHAAGDLAAAEQMYRRMLERYPQLVETYLALARLLVEQRRAEEAVTVLREALRVRPKAKEARLQLAELYREHRDYQAAAACLSEYLALAPGDSDALYTLGLAHLGADRVADAVQALRGAIRHDPAHAAAHLRLGQALHVQRRPDAAQAMLRRALDLEPGYAQAYHGLGHVLMSKGMLSEAHDCYRKALDIDPRLPGASLDIARSRRFAPGDGAAVERLESLLGREDLSREARSDLHFALGKVMDDLGRYARAFEYYHTANALVAQAVSFDRAQLQTAVARIIGTFSKGYFDARADFGHDSRSPVFIVGMLRSGTTLVEQIIASHPEAYGADELPYVDELTQKLAGRVGTRVSYPRCAEQMTQELTRELAEWYLDKTRAIAGGARRVIDKMPLNFFHLGFIASLFRDARIIHCSRAPLDACLSIYFQSFDRGHEWAYDVGDIAFFYRHYARLMAHWREVLPVEMLEVDYETLVAEPEPVTRKLIEHCGLDWDDRCLSPHRSERTVHTASNWQVRQPLYRSSCGRWRNYEPYIERLKAELGDLLGPSGDGAGH